MSADFAEAQSGAPLRLLAVFLSLWIMGRLLWISLDDPGTYSPTAFAADLELTQPDNAKSSHHIGNSGGHSASTSPAQNTAAFSKSAFARGFSVFGDHSGNMDGDYERFTPKETGSAVCCSAINSTFTLSPHSTSFQI